jgi:membrane-associated protease RseP (regulator of RpoE activity)
MGHMIATKWHGIKSSWPYFIPGVPGILPTFGAMIQIRSSMINRNVQFDVGIAGPIAGLLVAVIASVYGSSMSVLVPLDHAPLLLDGLQLIEMKSSIIMLAAFQLTGNAGIGQDAVLIMSPVMFAAWFGFLITFLNLMPAWQLDGGHLVRAALGVRWHKILTYSSIGVLFGLQFYPMAMLVLILSMRSPESTPLDDVSKLSAKRKALFWVAIALAVLCAPVFNSAMYAPLPNGLFSFLP